jgi:pilus assembly protein Flp/PilA
LRQSGHTEIATPLSETRGYWQTYGTVFSLQARIYFMTEHQQQGRFAMIKLLDRLWQEEEGQDLVEYGLLLVLVALGAIAAMGSLASAVSNAFGNASSNLSSS